IYHITISLQNLYSFIICFFFQAEDGIRDRNVTGVQTCALPISYRNTPLSRAQQARNNRNRRVRRYVEHPFSALKRRYGMAKAKAKTKLRNKARFILGAICWNIERSISWAQKNSNLTSTPATWWE